MSALTYVILTLMAVSTLSMVIYSVCVTRIRRKHAKSMQYFDPIKLNIDGEWETGYYVHQIDSNTHRVNIDGTIHDVNFKDIVKVLTVTILMLLSIPVTAQSEYYLNFGWTKQNVKIQNRQLELIYSGHDYLEYKVPDGYIAYEFTDRHCTTASVCMDSTAAISFIAERLDKNWRQIKPNLYHYYPDNVDTIQIKADWFGGCCTMKYQLMNSGSFEK